MAASGNPYGVIGIIVTVLVVAGVSIPMWLAITGLLGAMSGWFGLQRRYGGRDPNPALTLRMRSGRMGLGVQLRGCLTLTAGSAGLGLSIWRLFAGRQRPLLIPWREIAVTPDASIFGNYTRLGFGHPEIGHLLIATWVWEKLLRFSSDGDGVFSPEARAER